MSQDETYPTYPTIEEHRDGIANYSLRLIAAQLAMAGDVHNLTMTGDTLTCNTLPTRAYPTVLRRRIAVAVTVTVEEDKTSGVKAGEIPLPDSNEAA